MPGKDAPIEDTREQRPKGHSKREQLIPASQFRLILKPENPEEDRGHLLAYAKDSPFPLNWRYCLSLRSMCGVIPLVPWQLVPQKDASWILKSSIQENPGD